MNFTNTFTIALIAFAATAFAGSVELPENPNNPTTPLPEPTAPLPGLDTGDFAAVCDGPGGLSIY